MLQIFDLLLQALDLLLLLANKVLGGHECVRLRVPMLLHGGRRESRLTIRAELLAVDVGGGSHRRA